MGILNYFNLRMLFCYFDQCGWDFWKTCLKRFIWLIYMYIYILQYYKFTVYSMYPNCFAHMLYVYCCSIYFSCMVDRFYDAIYHYLLFYLSIQSIYFINKRKLVLMRVISGFLYLYKRSIDCFSWKGGGVDYSGRTDLNPPPPTHTHTHPPKER